MPRTDPGFAMHYQRVWEERSHDVDLPKWQRVAFLAFGRHTRNGHAHLEPNELRDLLVGVNRTTGELTRPRKSVVTTAIRTAVEKGYLKPGSNATCLIVAPWAVSGGTFGLQGTPCGRHR